MKYSDFVKISKWMNKTGKGSFTDEELKIYTQDLWAEYKASKQNGMLTNAMQSLCENLYMDMDYLDYADNVNEVRTIAELDTLLKDFMNFIA